jgi:hypothetical protein
MIRKLLAVFVGAAALALVASNLTADDKPATKTLEGKLVCGKCKLSETEKCSNVLLVKDGDKEVKYYLKDNGNKAKYHKCQGEKEVKVTGVVKEIEEKGEKKKVIESEKKGEPIKVEDK